MLILDQLLIKLQKYNLYKKQKMVLLVRGQILQVNSQWAMVLLPIILQAIL